VCCVCSFLRYCYIVKIDFVLAKIAVEYSGNRDTVVEVSVAPPNILCPKTKCHLKRQKDDCSFDAMD